MKQTIPSYWEKHLQEKIQTIHNHQIASGTKSASVALITDMHWNQNEYHSGAMLEKIMFECGIPYFFNAGDLVSGQGVCPPEMLFDEMLDYRYHFASIEHKCLMAEGNHDAAYSTFEGHGYVENVSKELFHEYYFRPYTQYKDRVFGEDMSYCYADDTVRKIRYIVLNSHDTPSDEKTEEGFAKYNTMRYFGFLQKQIDWFANVALNVPDKTWSVVVCSHATYVGAQNEEHEFNYALMAGVINAFKKHTRFSGKTEYDDPLLNAEISVDFTGKGGNFVAWLGGHVHINRITILDGITYVETASDASYEAYLQTGKRGKIQEHAFSVFTIDPVKHKVYVTRIGKGDGDSEDKEFEYEVF